MREDSAFPIWCAPCRESASIEARSLSTLEKFQMGARRKRGQGEEKQDSKQAGDCAPFLDFPAQQSHHLNAAEWRTSADDTDSKKC